MTKKHFYLGHDYVEAIEFTPVPNSVPRKVLPERNMHEHAANLRQCYDAGFLFVEDVLAQRREKNLPVADGAYMDVDLRGNVLPFDKLDTRRGARLMTVSEPDGDITRATVFLPLSRKSWLIDKLDQYEHEETINGSPKNKPLINAIESITHSEVRSLFPNKDEYDRLVPNTSNYFEIWINGVEDDALNELRNKMEILGLKIVGNNIIFF